MLRWAKENMDGPQSKFNETGWLPLPNDFRLSQFWVRRQTSRQQASKQQMLAMFISVGEPNLRGLPDKRSIVYENLPDFRPFFCPIMADVCKSSDDGKTTAPPNPLSPTPMAMFLAAMQLMWTCGTTACVLKIAFEYSFIHLEWTAELAACCCCC